MERRDNGAGDDGRGGVLEVVNSIHFILLGRLGVELLAACVLAAPARAGGNERRERFEAPASGSCVAAIPGIGESAADVRGWVCDAWDARTAKPYPACARIGAVDERDRVVWWLVQAEAPQGPMEVRLGERRAGARVEIDDPLQTEVRGGAVVVVGPRWTFRSNGDEREGLRPEITWSDGVRWALRAVVRRNGSTIEPRLAARIESATPLRAVVVLGCESPVRVWMRLAMWRSGRMELESMIGSASSEAWQVDGAELEITADRPWRTVRPVSAPDRKQGLVGPWVLRAYGGPMLLLESGGAVTDRARGVGAWPRGLVVDDGGAAACVVFDRFELRDPAAMALCTSGDDRRDLRVRWLDRPAALLPGERVSGRVRWNRVDAAAGERAADRETARLDVPAIALLPAELYRRSELLGFAAGVAAPAAMLLDEPLRKAWPAWLTASRREYGLGFRNDGDPPLWKDTPSHHEYDAVRAAITGAVMGLSGGLETALAGQLHWRAVDLGGPDDPRLPWMHAKEHARTGAEPGHCWIEGLLDLSFLSDDTSLRDDCLRTARALADEAARSDADLERSTAWPILALAAVQRVDPGRTWKDALGAYADLLLSSIDEATGLPRPSTRVADESFSWSPWLGGGLTALALRAFHRSTGDSRAADALVAIDGALRASFDPKVGAIAKRMMIVPPPVGKPGVAAQMRRSGVLRGSRNLLALAAVSLENARDPDPARLDWIHRVLRSSPAQTFKTPAERSQWWTLAFRCWGCFMSKGGNG